MSKTGMRRADYTLYDWQIRAIRQLAYARQLRPSQLVQELLTQALKAQPIPMAERRDA